MSFVIFAMPRSRTKWLSTFLSYGPFLCGHDELRHCRSLDDIRSWFAQPHTGTVETAAAPFWRLLERLVPGARVVTLKNDPATVTASLARAGLVFDEPVMLRLMQRLLRKLEQIEERLPDVLSLWAEDLSRESWCGDVFEHCLGIQHDPEWYDRIAPVNIQADLPRMVLYANAYAQQTEKLRRMARHEVLRGFRRPVELDGVTFQQEPLAQAYRDGAQAMSDECMMLGEYPEAWQQMNIPLLERLEEKGALHIYTARSNGRMFGYVVTALGEAFHAMDQVEAEQVSFYADPSWPGLGRKLQHAAIEDLRRSGVNRVMMFQPDETRVGLVYRRLGAKQTGQRYVLELQ